MLEAGPFFDPAVDSQQLQWPWESPRRGASTTRAFGDFDAAYGGWEIDGEPYTPNSLGSALAASLPYVSTLCGACKEVCPVKIDIPEVSSWFICGEKW